MELTKDTPTTGTDGVHPDDPHQTGSGNSTSPGGKDAPTQSAYEMSHGQEEYPGPSAGGETNETGEKPDGKA